MIADINGDFQDFLDQGDTPSTLPILAVRNLVLFPGVLTPILIGRDSSKALIQKAEKKGPYCTIPAKERTTKCTEAEQKCAKAEGKCDKAEQKCAKAEGKCEKAEGKCDKAQLNTPDCCQKEFKCCPKTECNKEDKSGCCNKDANAHCLKNKKAE